jgi:hypothetical protein
MKFLRFPIGSSTLLVDVSFPGSEGNYQVLVELAQLPRRQRKSRWMANAEAQTRVRLRVPPYTPLRAAGKWIQESGTACHPALFQAVRHCTVAKSS